MSQWKWVDENNINGFSGENGSFWTQKWPIQITMDLL